MKLANKLLFLFTLALALLAPAASAQTVWSEGTYYPDSSSGQPTISAIPWTALTHVDFVGGSPQSGGSITLSSSFTADAAALISAAHTNSVKVDYELTNVGSGTDFNDAMTGSCSSGAMHTFVANIMSTVTSYSFDGVVVDYEETYSTQFPIFMSCLRTALGSKLLIWYAGTNYQIGQLGTGNVPTCTGAVWPDGVGYTVSTYADRVIMSGYDLNDPVDVAGLSYFNSPLYSPSGRAVWSDDYAVKVAAACGIPAYKVSISIPFYGDLYSINTAPYQTENGSSTATPFYYDNLVTTYNLSSYTYDPTGHVPWMAVDATGGNPAGYISFENAQSVTDKINYVYANNLGGWMIWTLGTDYTSSASPTMPLLTAVGAAFTGGGGGGGGTATTPIFRPAAGSYTSSQSVTMVAATGPVICYNTSGAPATNGSTGCTTGTLYTGAVSVPSSETLYAVAGGTGYTDSAVGSATYAINSEASNPSCSPGTGTYSPGTAIACTSPNVGTAVLCYTTTGTTPATNGLGTGCMTGTEYTAAITASATETLKIIAGTSTLSDSSVITYAYTITSAASSPACSPTSGVAPQTVTCTNPNSGTTDMCYAVSPAIPITNGAGTACTTGTKYTTAIAVSVAQTLNIVAGTSIASDSSVVFYTYTSGAPTAVPTACSPLNGCTGVSDPLAHGIMVAEGRGPMRAITGVGCAFSASPSADFTFVPCSGPTGFGCANLPALTGDTTSSAGSCATITAKINGTSFTGTNGHVVSFGAGNIPADSGIVAANVILASSPGAGVAHFAGSTQTATSSTITTADIAANAVTSAKEAVVNTRRSCDIAIGDASGSAITSGQLGPQKRICYIPAAATIVEMDVAADAGTPNVIVAVDHAGSNSNIVSSALATAGSGAIACSNTGGTTGIDTATTCSSTLQNTSIAAGDYLELVSGTPGGTAKLMTVHVIYTIN